VPRPLADAPTAKVPVARTGVAEAARPRVEARCRSGERPSTVTVVGDSAVRVAPGLSLRYRCPLLRAARARARAARHDTPGPAGSLPSSLCFYYFPRHLTRHLTRRHARLPVHANRGTADWRISATTPERWRAITRHSRGSTRWQRRTPLTRRRAAERSSTPTAPPRSIGAWDHPYFGNYSRALVLQVGL